MSCPPAPAPPRRRLLMPSLRRAPTRAGPRRSASRGSCATSPPARPGGSPRRAWSTWTATAGRRSWRRSTRRSSSTPRGASWAAGTATQGRVYAPVVVADLDGDGKPEIVVGGNRAPWRRTTPGTAAPPEARLAGLGPSGGQTPEVRGLAAADLNGDGRVEVVATTTNTSPTGAQVFVFDAQGNRFQPRRGHHRRGRATTGWPARATTCTSTGSATTGTASTARTSPSATSTTTPTWRSSPRSTTTRSTPSTTTAPRSWRRSGSPTASRSRRPADGLGPVHPLGRPARREAPLPPAQGAWPSPARQAWLQWTASPPVGRRPRRRRPQRGHRASPTSRGTSPTAPRAIAFMALDGAYGKGRRSARRHRGFEQLPMSNHPVYRPDGDWYPPSGIPAPTVVDIVGDDRPEIVAALPGGKVYAVSPTGTSSGPTSTHRGARRRSPPRWSRPTSTRTAPRSWSSAPMPCTATPAGCRALGPREEALGHPAASPGLDGNGIGVPLPPRSATSPGTARWRSC